MQALHRVSATEWHLEDRTTIAVITRYRMPNHNTDVWRSLTWHQDPDQRRFIGFFPTLETATWITWDMWVQDHKPPARHVYRQTSPR